MLLGQIMKMLPIHAGFPCRRTDVPVVPLE
jgi:hypothetical protein